MAWRHMAPAFCFATSHGYGSTPARSIQCWLSRPGGRRLRSCSVTPSNCLPSGSCAAADFAIAGQLTMLARSATFFEVLVHLLCVATSLLCAYLLVLAYRASRTGVLIWSAVCF